MDSYKTLIGLVSNFLKKEGFKKNSDEFYIHKDNNWGIISFQKSKEANPNEFVFTINLGVVSNSIITYLGDKVDKPNILDCHWKQRIGYLLSSKSDFWWKIDSTTNLDILTSEIINILETAAIPEIYKHISDESLEKMWLSNEYGGLTELERYINLTTILKIYNRENLDSIINEMKNYAIGKPFAISVRVHLKQLGISI